MVQDRFRMRSLLPLYASLLVGVLVSLGVVLIRNSGSMEILELKTYDWLLRLRPEKPAKVNRKLAECNKQKEETTANLEKLPK